jgi:lysine 2,3-aminomutase
VLLKGVNDDPAIMLRLVRNLLSIRVRPYYLHQMDMVRGTGHFRTTIETGLDIMASLRGHTSGLAVPSYVIDLPGGKGKVPLLPETVRRENGRFLVQNFLGEEIHYPWGDREPARSCGELRMVHGAFGGGDDGPLGKVMP